MLFLYYTFLIFISSVIADVSISSPSAGKSYAVSGSTVSVEVEWTESNAEPTLDDIESMSFVICTGPNSDINGLQTIKKATSDELSDKKITLSIPADVGASGSYYIQIYSTTKDDGYTINYSQRFKLTGMTGTEKASGSGDPPSGQTSVGGDSTSSTLSPEEMSKSFSVAYTSQTGPTRYAPMQTQPGTTVTKSTWSRKFQTSAVSYFSSIKPSPSVLSTITPGWDYTISSVINQASVASDPSAVGWYNPKSKLKSATLSSNPNRASSSSSK
ncbi:Cell wall synthesis protein [Wickerhamomyces ciferrii]|uniref:Cell wall synthesis protein n=1 Tax=Wickerhamomyces ciferrii (strain ATCC 14091 / BCRC 22168 / CBS 111 / JCM 3599 / NBRC 0793 / NRRL Y-1031 F-60-10) TaxID=1206466 RepID=K0L0H1_WICCF|nr:Cell wall synthesis protein [Wickerhamomyces ciferrii]CCH46933.1 Cell wall synthesis protein [Wickerhamomyces ciferrii]